MTAGVEPSRVHPPGQVEATCDVCILGYGPVGAALACLLARGGLSVVVIDQSAGIYDKPRAITIDHEGLHALQLCGIGKALEAMIEPHPGTDYLGLDRGLIRTFYPQDPPYPLSWLPNVVFIQPELEALLRHTVTGLEGVTTWLSHRATGIEQTGDRVRIETRRAGDDQVRIVDAAVLVGCDGASSFVRGSMGTPLEDLDFDEWWMVVDAWQREPAPFPPRCVQYCWPERPATFIRGPRNLLRWEIKLLPGEDPDVFGQPEAVARTMAGFAPAGSLEIWRSAVYRFHALVARGWHRDRLLLAGDAAHQTPPFMGQGLCAGLRDVVNLAWKLRMVLRQGADPVLLDTYETERRPHFRTVVARTKEIGQIIGELDPARAAERDLRLRQEMTEGRVVTRQGFIPPLLDGFLHQASPGSAGVLFVQPSVHCEGELMRLDELYGLRFLLVLRSPSQRGWLGSDQLAFLDRIGAAVLVIAPAGSDGPADFIEDGSLVRDWFDRHGGEVALVRPDRYVFGVAQSAAVTVALLNEAEARLFAGTTTMGGQQ